MSIVVDVAQAVTDELNGGSFSQSFTAERHYQPVFELPDMKTLHVTVVPRAVDVTVLDRGRCREDVQVDIAVQKRIGSDCIDEIDALMGVVREIDLFFRQRRLHALPEAIWVGTANDPVYAGEHLQELHQFTSVLTLTYRMAA